VLRSPLGSGPALALVAGGSGRSAHGIVRQVMPSRGGSPGRCGRRAPDRSRTV